MYTEVGGISSDGTAVPVPEKKKVQYKRIQIIEADSSDDEEEEEDSTLPFISGMYEKANKCWDLSVLIQPFTYTSCNYCYKTYL